MPSLARGVYNLYELVYTKRKGFERIEGTYGKKSGL